MDDDALATKFEFGLSVSTDFGGEQWIGKERESGRLTPPDSIEEQKMIGFSHLGKRIG
jgi:hypothetical protein